MGNHIDYLPRAARLVHDAIADAKARQSRGLGRLARHVEVLELLEQLRRRRLGAGVVARGVQQHRSAEGELPLVHAARHVQREAGLALVLGRVLQHVLGDLDERDHLELGLAVPLGDTAIVEELLALRLVLQLELERGERRAALLLVGLVHKQVRQSLSQRRRHLSQAVCPAIGARTCE